jgi:methylated-DNA-[protein]-cysteine S-methyltransferase
MTALATDRGLAALLFDSDKIHTHHHPELPDRPEHPMLNAAQAWLEAYWKGDSPEPGSLPLDLAGSSFQCAVWHALLQIPLGQTRTYGQIAQQLQPAAAPRATGSAIGRNPVAIVVPCHRVIGANGSLTGYASGLPLKLKLLQHEGALLL